MTLENALKIAYSIHKENQSHGIDKIFECDTCWIFVGKYDYYFGNKSVTVSKDDSFETFFGKPSNYPKFEFIQLEVPKEYMTF